MPYKTNRDWSKPQFEPAMKDYQPNYEPDDDDFEDRNSYRKVTLWEIRSTEKAILFAPFPEDVKTNNKPIWLPRSQMKHISRDPAIPPSTWRRCTVDIAEWLLEKHGL